MRGLSVYACACACVRVIVNAIQSARLESPGICITMVMVKVSVKAEERWI